MSDDFLPLGKLVSGEQEPPQNPVRTALAALLAVITLILVAISPAVIYFIYRSV